MKNNKFCCDGFSTAIDNARDSGFSVLVKIGICGKTFFFVQQYRNKGTGDKKWYFDCRTSRNIVLSLVRIQS